MRILECPFTWEIDKEAASIYEAKNDNKDLDRDSDFMEMVHPLFLNLRYVIFAYADTVRKDYNNARECLKKLAETWNKVDQSKLTKEGISVRVVIHVIEATKYCIYREIGDQTEVNKILADLQDFVNFTDQIDLGTLYGCKTLVWQILHEHRKKNAIHFAKLAIRYSSNCALWHFILGKHLRDLRRNEDLQWAFLSDDEASAFLESYKLSKSPNYGIYVAQMYREMKQYDKSNEIYLEIYYMNPRDFDIQLRLALGFLGKNDFKRAKSCLDCVEQLAPHNSRYFHYKGNYFYRQKNFTMAVKYYKKAVEGERNLGAELQYVLCMQKLGEEFDFMEYYLAMLEKYKKPYSKQRICIIVAFDYISYKQYANALKYFLEAIKVYSVRNGFENYFSAKLQKYFNIIPFIRDELLPKIKELSTIPIDVQNMVAEIENLIS